MPNKTITCDNRNPPWMTTSLKSAIKRKHRVYNKYVKLGRKPNDWEYVRTIRNQTSSKITQAKDKYFSSLGKKLSDPTHGTKSSTSSTRKSFPIYHLYWKMECSLPTFKPKQIFLIITLSSNVY